MNSTTEHLLHVALALPADDRLEFVEALVASLRPEDRPPLAFVKEPQDSIPASSSDDIFAEMEPFMVEASGADCSRLSLYNRMSNE